jgi:replicative DNA helicase
MLDSPHSPHSEDAEKSVLGAIMIDGLRAMDECLRLRPEHFYLQSHQEIFKAFRSQLVDHPVIDVLAIQNALGSRINAVGGIAYVVDLSAGIFRGFDITQRVDTILEKWKLRRGMEICDQYGARFRNSGPSAETLAALQSEVLEAIQETTEQDEPLVAAYSNAAFDELMQKSFSPNATGLSYGVNSLDSWTCGMQPGQVTVVGARSGVGKSALMKQAAAANARKGIPVTMFSLEMTRDEILGGLWAIVSGVEYRKVTRPHLLRPDERAALQTAMQTVKGWPLRIYDKAELDINQIVAFARMNVRRYGAKLVCVDYAQSVEAEGRDERTKVASVSRKLTKMAKAEQCSLMLLSQLRKVSHEYYSHPPTVADLRETGQLENDAHIVILLHRGWDSQACCVEDNASIIIPKVRAGKTGALHAKFNPNNLCFE